MAARERYSLFLKEYPRSGLAEEARAGIASLEQEKSSRRVAPSPVAAQGSGDAKAKGAAAEAVSSQVQSTKDKVPVIGDVPLVGRLFQSSSKTAQKKNLMIFVTATIVDPAGNRVHSDDDLPFAQTGVPSQPPGAGQTTESVQTLHSLPAAPAQ